MWSWAPNIYDFLDYRAYLKAFYDAGKANTRAFSYRFLAERAGYGSPNTIRYVIQGKRNISSDGIERLIPVFHLDDDEASYFRALVSFDQAETAEEKNQAFEQIAATRRFKQARQIDTSLLEYLSHWYYSAVRELAAREDFEADAAWIVARFKRQLTRAQARSALKKLMEWRLLVEDEEGHVVRRDVSLATPHEVQNLAIGNYHREMLSKAAASIEDVEREHRDIAGVTVCIAPELVPELKQRARAFRENVLHLCDSDERPARVVYQFNTQLFPLSDPES